MKSKGFTLIELMVTVAIVAILAAIALPSYSRYVQKSRRSEAFNALTSVVNAMEKYRLSTNVYPSSMSTLDAVIGSHGLTPSGALWVSQGGNYLVEILSDSGGTNWRVSATAQAAQLPDTDCRKILLALTGVKSAENASGGNTTATCWPD